MDFVRRWSGRTEIGAGRFIRWLDITASKFYGWRERYGKINEHNGWVPRDFWLEDWKKQESGQRVAGAESGGTAAEVEREALEERDRL